jgi:hypothetical protein
VSVIVKIKVPILPLVPPIVGDRHYKDKSANDTRHFYLYNEGQQQWQEQVVTLSLLSL